MVITNAYLQMMLGLIKAHSYLSGMTAVLGLMVLFLRKMHYRFVVFPDIQGRSNRCNSFQYQHPKNKGLECQDLQIATSDKLTLRGWYIKHPKPQSVVLYYHQNAGNIGGRIYYINQLMKNVNTNVIIVAYRGFSDSDGDKPPNQQEIMTDAQAIMRKAVELTRRDGLPLVVFGRSLGGAASINTLSQPEFTHSAKALILQNTFTSIFDVAYHLTPRFLFFLAPLLYLITSHSYCSLNKLHKLHVPILFVKGCKDLLIPKEHMDRLQKVYSQLKERDYQVFQVENGTHNDTWLVGGREYFTRFKGFTEKWAKL